MKIYKYVTLIALVFVFTYIVNANADTVQPTGPVSTLQPVCNFNPNQVNKWLKKAYKTHKILDSYKGSHKAKKKKYVFVNKRGCQSDVKNARDTYKNIKKRLNTWLKKRCSGGSPKQNRCLGERMVKARGWSNSQWNCVNSIWGKYESGWNTYSDNPTSDAYGIPQALPGPKMGPGWETNPRVQIRWGIGYINGRYGTACNALSSRLSQGWY